MRRFLNECPGYYSIPAIAVVVVIIAELFR